MAHSSESTDIRQVNDDWTLPFDVMSIVMAISDRSTISALMKSCRTFYSEGPKHILCDGVELGSADQIVLFANFMLTEDPSRFAHLRTLDLSLRLYDLDCLAQARLTDILSHTSLVLETLILREVDLLLEGAGVASLREAFGRLKTIKHLVVRGVQEEGADMIKSLPSKLESISIGVIDPDGSDVDLLSMLKPFSDTLHTLPINSVPYIPAVSPVESPEPCAFLHVRTFGVVCHKPGAVTTLLASPVFSRAFPTITHLKLIPTDPPTPLNQSALYRPWRLDRAIRLRERNRVRRFKRHGDGAFPALSSLRECSGRLYDVYALALGHTLSTLRLWQDVGTGDFPILGAVLEDTCPECLCLTADDVEQLSDTLCTLQHQTPPRIDLNMSVSVSSWCYPLEQKILEERFCYLLEPLLQPLPTGLVELNVLFIISLDPDEQLMVNDALGEVEHWAGIVAPSLTFSCSIAVGEDWEWPDLGQDDRRDNPFSATILDTLFDNDDDDFDYDDYEDELAG